MIDEKRYAGRIIKLTVGEDELIRKHFVRKAAKENELFYHNELVKAGLTVPRLYKNAEKAIYYDYIPSIHYLDVLDIWERDEDSDFSIWQPLAEWLCKLYKECPGVVVGDPNLRNFILDTERKCYGIDFEEYRQGKIIDDIGLLLAYISTYKPAYTEGKKKVCNYLIDYFITHLNITRPELVMTITKQIAELEHRRAGKIMKGKRKYK